MEIIKADLIGFCMGVRRAVETANQVIADYEGYKIFTLGPIIHNPSVVSDLKAQGVDILEDDFSMLDEKSVVIIRAHGVPPAELDRITATGAIVVDATCPRVLASKKIVQRNVEKGKTVVLVGDKDHGEVKAVSGQSEKVYVVDPKDELKEELDKDDAIVLVAQTTIKHDEFDKVYTDLKARFDDVKLVNTICASTEKRQEALLDLIGKVDVVVVIGGKNSANTQRLAMTVTENGLPAFHVETENDLTDEILSYEKIGIAAGASTPDNVIENVILKIEEIFKTNNRN